MKSAPYKILIAATVSIPLVTDELLRLDGHEVKAVHVEHAAVEAASTCQ